MLQHTLQSVPLGMSKRFASFFVSIVLIVLSGCNSQSSATKHDVNDEGMRVGELRDLVAIGDEKSAERLIESLDDESQWVRHAAKRGLEVVLKRKIYFDPAAPAAERERQLSEVRGMWRNLQERDLFEAVKRRMPIQYFYDLNTGELFEARAGMAPIETDSGMYEGMPAGVRAVVFACRDCGDDRYVAWVQVPVAQLDRYDVAYDSTGGKKKRGQTDVAIRSPEGGDWALLGTPAAVAIAAAARHCADRPQPIYCRPGR